MASDPEVARNSKGKTRSSELRNALINLWSDRDDGEGSDERKDSGPVQPHASIGGRGGNTNQVDVGPTRPSVHSKHSKSYTPRDSLHTIGAGPVKRFTEKESVSASLRRSLPVESYQPRESLEQQANSPPLRELVESHQPRESKQQQPLRESLKPRSKPRISRESMEPLAKRPRESGESHSTPVHVSRATIHVYSKRQQESLDSLSKPNSPPLQESLKSRSKPHVTRESTEPHPKMQRESVDSHSKPHTPQEPINSHPEQPVTMDLDRNSNRTLEYMDEVGVYHYLPKTPRNTDVSNSETNDKKTSEGLNKSSVGSNENKKSSDGSTKNKSSGGSNINADVVQQQQLLNNYEEGLEFHALPPSAPGMRLVNHDPICGRLIPYQMGAGNPRNLSGTTVPGIRMDGATEGTYGMIAQGPAAASKLKAYVHCFMGYFNTMGGNLPECPDPCDPAHQEMATSANDNENANSANPLKKSAYDFGWQIRAGFLPETVEALELLDDSHCAKKKSRGKATPRAKPEVVAPPLVAQAAGRQNSRGGTDTRVGSDVYGRGTGSLTDAGAPKGEVGGGAEGGSGVGGDRGTGGAAGHGVSSSARYTAVSAPRITPPAMKEENKSQSRAQDSETSLRAQAMDGSRPGSVTSLGRRDSVSSQADKLLVAKYRKEIDEKTGRIRTQMGLGRRDSVSSQADKSLVAKYRKEIDEKTGRIRTQMADCLPGARPSLQDELRARRRASRPSTPHGTPHGTPRGTPRATPNISARSSAQWIPTAASGML